jgi:hypothetical protein
MCDWGGGPNQIYNYTEDVMDKKGKSPLPQKTNPPKTGNVRERGRVGDSMISDNKENVDFVKGTIEPEVKK